jgi:sulfite exporter TauE/SafE
MEFLVYAITAGFGLGLASTLHCAGMCGAMAASLVTLGGPQSASAGVRTAALIHIGRVGAYALAGAIVGGVGQQALSWLDREAAFRLVHWAGAAALLWIGLSTAGLLPALSGLDRVLSPVADRVLRATRAPRGQAPSALASGFAWGLMPCAMVYGALFTALMSGSAVGGGTVMLAFGIGTLPGLVAATLGVGFLQRAGARQHLRMAAGLAIAGLGVLSVWSPYGGNGVLCLPGTASSFDVEQGRPLDGRPS